MSSARNHTWRDFEPGDLLAANEYDQWMLLLERTEHRLVLLNDDGKKREWLARVLPDDEPVDERGWTLVKGPSRRT